METNQPTSQPASSDSTFADAPMAQTGSCCAEDHHQHVYNTSHGHGFHSLAAAAASGHFHATTHGSGSSAPKSSGAKNRKRKRTSRACVYCQKLHLSCDEQRPCIRCVKAGRADQCKDGKRKRRGRKRKSMPADDDMMDEDVEVDIDTVGSNVGCSHSDEEDDLDEEASSSSATVGIAHSPRQEEDSAEFSAYSSVSDVVSLSPVSKRRAVGRGAEPSTNWRDANDLMADSQAECEIASMLVSLQARGPAIKVFA